MFLACPTWLARVGNGSHFEIAGHSQGEPFRTANKKKIPLQFSRNTPPGFSINASKVAYPSMDLQDSPSPGASPPARGGANIK